MRALGAGFSKLHIVCFTLRKDGHRVTDISPNTRVYPTNSVSRLLYIVDAARIAARLRDVAVVSAQDPFESGLAGYLASRRLGVPLQLQVHTDLMSPYFKKFFMNRVRLFIARLILPRASCVRVVSERIKRSLAPLHLRAPVSVLPIHTDLSQLALAPRGEIRSRYREFSHLVLVVSRLEEEKNVVGAVRAFAQVLEKFPHAGLLIVGTGSQKSALQALARALGIEASVRFEGFREPAPYYKDANVLLNASWYEGYGLSIVEALVLHCPVVSTDVGVAREAGARIAEPQHLGRELADALAAAGEAKLLICPPSEAEYLRAYRQSLRACSR